MMTTDELGPEHGSEPASGEVPASDVAADMASDVAADVAARHSVGEALPVVASSLAEPAADEETLEPIDAVGEHVGASAATETRTDVQEPALTEAVIETPAMAADPLHLERKHLLGIRWMHWINFPVLFTMIWSGLLIYWNDSDNAYQHPHRVYQIGIGNLTLFRFFPDWFYTLIHAQYNVTKGLGYHFFFMWVFAINGILYVAYLLVTREWKFMVPDRRSISEAIQVTLIDMRLLKKPLPFQTKYNGAQKIAYTSILVMGLGSLVTGLAIYKPTSAHWLTTLLGGYEMARWLHFMLTIGFCAFFLIHVYQVAAAGWNNFRAMVTGYELRRASEPSLETERSRF